MKRWAVPWWAVAMTACDPGCPLLANGLPDCSDPVCAHSEDVCAPWDLADQPCALTPQGKNLPEVCDGLDNDCDGFVDNLVPGHRPLQAWYYDRDQDGVGGFFVQRACKQPKGYVAESGDCDDFDPHVPGPETCAKGDGDCNGVYGWQEIPTSAWYVDWLDADGDGLGNPLAMVTWCENAPAGTVSNDSDCDDTDPSILDGLLWSADADGDGFGSGPVEVASVPCEPPHDGWQPSEPVDCDDGASHISPAAPELPGTGADEDCDNEVDESTSYQESDATTTWDWPTLPGGPGSLVWIDDHDGDGARDLLSSLPGNPGHVLRLTADGTATEWLLGSPERQPGAGTLAVSVDSDADGWTDVVVGLTGDPSGSGGFGTIPGPLPAPPYPSGPIPQYVEGTPDLGLGGTLSASAALDDDATAELLVGSTGFNGLNARLFDLPLPPDAHLGLASLVVLDSARSIVDAVVIGDLDGDGIDEWAVSRTGDLPIFSGRPTGVVTPLDAPLGLRSETSAALRATPVGDVGGDGLPDVLLQAGAPLFASYVFYIVPPGSTPLTQAALIAGNSPYEWRTPPARSGSPGDVDGNGAFDLQVHNADSVDLLLLPAEGSLEWADFDFRLTTGLDPVGAFGAGGLTTGAPDAWIVGVNSAQHVLQVDVAL